MAVDDIYDRRSGVKENWEGGETTFVVGSYTSRQRSQVPHKSASATHWYGVLMVGKQRGDDGCRVFFATTHQTLVLLLIFESNFYRFGSFREATLSFEISVVQDYTNLQYYIWLKMQQVYNLSSQLVTSKVCV